MANANIIGRNSETQKLERLYNSQKSEFVAIYGRRRVGKSFLVNEFFGKKILFKAVG
ncbi:MAG: ATP-binding protein, partial [Muribaculaceae bacterium]|nr:ATP-binding protein [Muribaculaceae bacterium]